VKILKLEITETLRWRSGF